MNNKHFSSFAGLILAAVLAVPISSVAQQAVAAPPPAGSPQPDPQAISKSGLLPIYGVAVRLDPSWVDGSQFPSQSSGFANSGVTAELQQAWTTFQPGGLNVLRVPIDVRDAASAANRAANLCLWSSSNNVRLILLLTGSDEGQPLGDDYSRQVAAFVKTLAALLRGNNGQFLNSYNQIAAYQLEDELNHAGRHGGMTAAAQQLLLKAAQDLRGAERQALDGSGLQATPLMVSASFDFELIRARMIAGATMSDDAYGSAYKAVTQFLSPLAGSPDIDLIAVDWLPGSFSAGGVDKFPRLLRSLLSDLNGKQLILTTGFSTAFNGREDQKRFYALAFATLSDYRASVGLDCPFVGILFREAFNGKDQNPTPPRASLPGEMATWDWLAKAEELNKMWTENKPSGDMAWWLKRTENNLGMLAAPGATGTDSVASTPVQETLTQIATAVSNASLASPGGIAGAPATQSAANPDPWSNAAGPASTLSTFGPQPPAIPGQPGVGGLSTGAGQSSGLVNTLETAAQQGLLGLVNSVFQRLGNVISGGSGGRGFNQSDCGNFLPSNPSPTVPGAFASPSPCGTTVAGLGNQPGVGSASLNSASSFAPQPATPAQPAFASDNPAGSNTINTIASGSPTSDIPAASSNTSPGSPASFNATAANAGNAPSAGNPAGDSLPAANNTSPGSPASATPPASSAIDTTSPGSPGTVGLPASNATSLGNPASSNLTAANAVNANSPGGPASVSLPAANIASPGSPTIFNSPAASAINVISPGTPMPAIIQLSARDISFRPNRPQVNDSVTLAINLVNQGRSEAPGVLVFALGDDNSALARSDSLRIAPGVRATATLSKWIPTDAKTYHMTILVVDGFGNQRAALPLSVDVSPRAADQGSTAAASGTGAAGSAGLNSNSQLANPIVTTPVGAVSFAGLQAGNFAQGMVAGRPAAVAVSLSNPYLVPMSNVQATLVVDGKRSSTQALAVLLPGQTRSVLFPAVTIPSPGRHQMGVVLESQRPGAKPQLSVVMGQINVPDAQRLGAPGGVRSILGSGSVAAAQPASQTSGSTQPGVPTLGASINRGLASGGVRSILMPASGKAQPAVPNGPPSVATQSLISSNPTSPRLGNPGATQPPPPPKGQPRPDLVIRGDDIGYEPSLPAAGQRVSFSASVRNVGNGFAPRVVLIFRLIADGRPVAGSQPVQFALGPGSARRENWQAAMPAARQVELHVFVAENDGGNLINNKQAAIEIRAAPSRRRIPSPPRRFSQHK